MKFSRSNGIIHMQSLVGGVIIGMIIISVIHSLF